MTSLHLSRRASLRGLALGGAMAWLPRGQGEAQVHATSARGSPSAVPVILPAIDSHFGPLRAIAVSPDGRLVATGGLDRSVRIWDGSTQRFIRHWHPPLGEGEAGVVDALTFSPDGRLLYITAVDWVAPKKSAIYVLDTSSGMLRYRLLLHPTATRLLPHLAISPRGDLLAVGSHDSGILLFRVENGGISLPPLLMEPSSTGVVEAITFSPDGRRLAVGSQVRGLRLFAVAGDRVTEQPAPLSQRLPGQIWGLSFARDGQRLALGLAPHPEDARRSSPPQLEVMVVDLGKGQVTRLDRPVGQGNLEIVAWGPGDDGAEWLFAGGSLRTTGTTLGDSGGRNVVCAWREGQRGRRLDIRVAEDSITAMASFPAGGIVYAASDAAWGQVVTKRNGRSLDSLNTISKRLDFREVATRRWGLDASGGVVEFQSLQRGSVPLRFDLTALSVEALGTEVPRGDLRRPRNVDARSQRREPWLLERERIQARDVSPSDGSILVGTDEALVLLSSRGDVLERRAVAATPWGVVVAGNGRVAAVAHGDGSIRWYSMSGSIKLLELGGLFALSPDRWIAWRNDGPFAHSDGGGERLVGFHQNGEYLLHQVERLTGHWLDADQAYRRLYDPEAIRRMLEWGPHWNPATSRAAIEAAATADPPITVSVAQICPTDELPQEVRRTRMIAELDDPAPDALPAGSCHELVASDQASTSEFAVSSSVEAVRVALAVDARGPNVMIDAFANGVNMGRRTYRTGGMIEMHVPLRPGTTQIEFRAYGSGDTFFRSAPLIVTRSGFVEQQRPAGGTLRVLSVGIDGYLGTVPALRFAVADAMGFANAVRRAAPETYGAVATPKVLQNGEATLAGIRTALADLAAEADQDDAVLIYLAGHGVAVGGAYAFVPVDVRDAASAEQRGAGCLSADMLVAHLAELRALRTMLLLDTCYGGAFDVIALRREEPLAGRLHHESGRFVLTASTRLQAALDGYNGQHGVFGFAVIEALEGGIQSGSRVLDALDFGRHVRERVPMLARERRFDQRPVFKIAGEVHSFPIAVKK